MIVILTGVSGVGKTTIASLLEKNHDFHRSISHTTRKMRENEEHEKDYVFIEKEDFEKKLENGFFLEHVHQFNNFYGTSYEQIEKLQNSGKNIVMCISHEGFLIAQKKWPTDVLGIYLLPPSIEELKERMGARASEVHTCDNRLDALSHTWHKEHYDHEIPAGTIDETLEKVLALIASFGLENI